MDLLFHKLQLVQDSNEIQTCDLLGFDSYGSYRMTSDDHMLRLALSDGGSQIPTCASIWPYLSEIILGFSAASILAFYWNNLSFR